MTVALSALPQFFDNSGNPVSGGKLFTYAAGTTTPLATYTDRGGLTSNANPVVLDSAGRADVWLSTNVAYKLVLQDSAGNTLDSVDQFYAGADPSQLTTAGIVPSTGGTYTGLVNFTGGLLFGGTQAQDLDTLNSLGIASVANSNLWANSDCFIFQRSILGSTFADGTVGFDRVVTLAQTASLTVANFDTAGLTTAGIAGRFTQPAAAAQRIGGAQIAEYRDCISYRNRQLAFSGRFRSSSAVTLRVALVAWTGTADAAPRDLVNNWTSTTYTAGNFFIASTLTIATAAVSLPANTWTDAFVSSTSAGGVSVPIGTNNIYMVFWTDTAVAQNVLLDFTEMVCGLGSEAQRWTPPVSALEVVKCYRYCQVIGGATGTVLGSGTMLSSTEPYVYGSLPATMRGTPQGTIRYGAAGFNQVTNGTVSATASAGATLSAFPSNYALDIPASALQVANGAVVVRTANANQYLLFEAEVGV